MQSILLVEVAHYHILLYCRPNICLSGSCKAHCRALFQKAQLCIFFVDHNCKTPEQLFGSLQFDDEEKNNSKWIDIIHEVVYEGVLAEDERVLSTTALERHWKRTSFWNNSSRTMFTKIYYHHQRVVDGIGSQILTILKVAGESRGTIRGVLIQQMQLQSQQ